MRVLDLQRVERPLHQVEAAGQRIVALRQLQPSSQPGVAILRQHRQHVRVQVRLAGATAGQRHGETHHRIPVQGPDPLAADAVRHDEDALWDQVPITVTPDRELYLDAALEVRQRLYCRNTNLGWDSRFSSCPGTLFRVAHACDPSGAVESGPFAADLFVPASSARLARLQSASSCSGDSETSASYP